MERAAAIPNNGKQVNSIQRFGLALNIITPNSNPTHATALTKLIGRTARKCLKVISGSLSFDAGVLLFV